MPIAICRSFDKDELVDVAASDVDVDVDVIVDVVVDLDS
jgi:hypothetical protein